MRRRIGSGAFATVWLAYDEHLDSPVAIKVLADNWTEDLHVRQRFVEEGRFLRKVESPHVVSVYDAGELDDGRPYLVMCFADQGTLADRIELTTLPPEQALSIISQVGSGLSALHHRGVLHRDVKPANVLFRTVDAGRSASIVTMLGDLGLGKAMDMSSRLTMIGGTPTYIAPEQARGEGLDGRADQYSLAALTYYLLTGRPPYDHPSIHAAADPKPPAPMGDAVPAEAEAVVRRGLSPDREGRYPDVEAYVAALAAAFDESGARRTDGPHAWLPADPDLTRATPRPEAPTAVVDHRPAPAPAPAPAARSRRPRRWSWPWAVAGVLALALGAGAGWTVERSIPAERTLEDSSRQISVTVPESWARHVDPDRWTPEGSVEEFASISAGTTPDWNGGDDPAPGVFVGVLAEDRLPKELPQHDCEVASSPIEDEADGDDSRTQYFEGCPGAEVTVERVIQATANRLVWVQVRSDDVRTANEVLASVEHGL